MPNPKKKMLRCRRKRCTGLGVLVGAGILCASYPEASARQLIGTSVQNSMYFFTLRVRIQKFAACFSGMTAVRIFAKLVSSTVVIGSVVFAVCSFPTLFLTH